MTRMGLGALGVAGRLAAAASRTRVLIVSAVSTLAMRGPIGAPRCRALFLGGPQGTCGLRHFGVSSGERCGKEKDGAPSEPVPPEGAPQTFLGTAERGPQIAGGPRRPPEVEDGCLASSDTTYQAAADLLLEGLAAQLQEVQETSGLEDVDYRVSVIPNMQ